MGNVKRMNNHMMTWRDGSTPLISAFLGLATCMHTSNDGHESTVVREFKVEYDHQAMRWVPFVKVTANRAAQWQKIMHMGTTVEEARETCRKYFVALESLMK